MPRRLPLLALIAGLAALLLGVAGLQRVFVRERSDALAALVGQQSALQGYAVMDLQERCQDEMAAQRSRLDAALRNPLVDAAGLTHHRNGRQLLPRRFDFREGSEARAQALYLILTDSEAELPTGDLDADDPWRDRLLLFAEFRNALFRGDRVAIERSFRKILTHRARYVISSRKDLAYQVAVLDLLERESDPDPVLMEKILRDGLTDSRGVRMHGLQAQVLARRDKLTQPDFEFLAGRIAKLSEQSGVRHDDFRARVAEGAGPAVAVPESIRGPMLLERGRWFVDLAGEGVVEGVAIDLRELLARTRTEMIDRGLLDDADVLSLDELSEHPQPMLALSLSIDSPRWASQRAAIDRRFWLKTGLSVTLVVFMAAAVLAWAAWTRRERQLLALKSDFVATVSHELRTPLASMRLMAETLQRRLSGQEAARDYPERLIREIDSLNFLVENILSFNRLEKGRWQPHVEDVRLSELVHTLETELQGATRAAVRVEVNGATDLVFRADPELMKLLFLNLGTNACKYNERDPVTIRIEAEDREPVKIRVADNGVGIPSEQRDKVFDEFYRAQVTGRGFGLGLAICQRIMDLHQGRIRVADSSQSGTVFELSFP